jgi:four helix bundle protein
VRGDDIAERLLDFAVRVIRLSQALPKTAVGRHIGGQLVRSGTGAGSNYEEARGAESRADFAHKLGISWKEMREAWYWLRVIHRAQLVQSALVLDIMQESQELSAILGKSVQTTKGNS